MQNELAKERPGRYDLKMGRGGLLDIEFVTQWLQMTHGRDLSVRTSDTSAALDALNAGRYLSRAHYETLRDGYLFLRRLEQRIHIAHGTSSTLIDERGPGLTQLARRMGLRDAPGVSARSLLLSRYRDVTSAVRRSYLEILGRTAE